MTKIASARVLVVGAGGIGCELLKTAILAGFRKLEVVDLDTIDLSNLNRQFLFNRSHIGKSKAEVACEVVKRFAADLDIKAYHANIKDSKFDVKFFQRFTLVINGLDNLDARKHVNRICLAARVPLIESGTDGYLGQMSVINPGVTECYECIPPIPPKTFAVCTIRSNPTHIIHCVHWARALFDRLWGVKSDSNAITDISNDETTPEKLFDKVFSVDIEELRSITSLWESKQPPEPITLEKVNEKKTETTVSTESSIESDLLVWDMKTCAEHFIESAEKLFSYKSYPIVWNKDNSVHLDFVCSAANIRAMIFHIKPINKFEVKSKAGNIIAAIATTNAIVSGLIVAQAIKICEGNIAKCNATFIQRFPTGKRLLLSASLEPPSPACYVCGCATAIVELNPKKFTLGQLVDRVLLEQFSFSEPTVVFGERVLYESGEDLDPDETTLFMNLSKNNLADFEIGNGSSLFIQDQSQKNSLTISIVAKEFTEPELEEIGFQITTNNQQEKVDKKNEEETKENLKRKREEEEPEVVEITHQRIKLE